MQSLIERLALYARSLLTVVAGLLAGGALISIMGLPLVGWSVYALGWLGLLLAVPALAAAYRPVLDRMSLIWLVVAWVGVVLGVPAVLQLVGFYFGATGPQGFVLPYEVTPLGLLGALAWAGLGLFGISSFMSRGVPRVAAIILVVAALMIVPAELGVLHLGMWALGVMLGSFGLVWLAPVEAEALKEPEPAIG